MTGAGAKAYYCLYPLANKHRRILGNDLRVDPLLASARSDEYVALVAKEVRTLWVAKTKCFKYNNAKRQYRPGQGQQLSANEPLSGLANTVPRGTDSFKRSDERRVGKECSS